MEENERRRKSIGEQIMEAAGILLVAALVVYFIASLPGPGADCTVTSVSGGGMPNEYEYDCPSH